MGSKKVKPMLMILKWEEEVIEYCIFEENVFHAVFGEKVHWNSILAFEYPLIF